MGRQGSKQRRVVILSLIVYPHGRGESLPGSAILCFTVIIKTSFTFHGFIGAKIGVLNTHVVSSLLDAGDPFSVSLSPPMERPALNFAVGWERGFWKCEERMIVRLALCKAMNLGSWRERAVSAHPERDWVESLASWTRKASNRDAWIVCRESLEEFPS